VWSGERPGVHPPPQNRNGIGWIDGGDPYFLPLVRPSARAGQILARNLGTLERRRDLAAARESVVMFLGAPDEELFERMVRRRARPGFAEEHRRALERVALLEEERQREKQNG